MGDNLRGGSSKENSQLEGVCILSREFLITSFENN